MYVAMYDYGTIHKFGINFEFNFALKHVYRLYLKIG